MICTNCKTELTTQEITVYRIFCENCFSDSIIYNGQPYIEIPSGRNKYQKTDKGRSNINYPFIVRNNNE